MKSHLPFSLEQCASSLQSVAFVPGLDYSASVNALHPALLPQPCTPDTALQIHHLSTKDSNSLLVTHTHTPFIRLSKETDAGIHQGTVRQPISKLCILQNCFGTDLEYQAL